MTMRVLRLVPSFAVAALLGAVAGMVDGGGLAAVAAQADPRVEAARPAKRLVIGIDLSKSNPLITDSGFATKVGQRVGEMVAELGFASEVHVRTLGSYDATSNSFSFDAVISGRQRPDAVAADVTRLISGTPMLVERGAWVAQDKTNILAFLDNAAHSFGCADMETHIVLATDGIEDSEYARLARAGATLPAPRGEPFAECASLQILGLGQGQGSPEKTIELRETWTAWAEAAGFDIFLGLNDW